MDYKIEPIAVEGFADADGVFVNSAGEWLGEVDWQGDKRVVLPYSDEGNYVPAPANWRERIVEALG